MEHVKVNHLLHDSDEIKDISADKKQIPKSILVHAVYLGIFQQNCAFQILKRLLIKELLNLNGN